MKVYALVEEEYSAWVPDYVADLEVFVTEELAQARIAVLAAAWNEDLITDITRDPERNYQVLILRERIAQVRAYSMPTQWYDVGMVTDANGIEAWKTAQRTVEEEVAYLEDEITGVKEKLAAHLAELQAAPPPTDRWTIIELEVIGA